MVLTYSCALLALTLCATPPSLGSAKTASGYRAAATLQRQQHQRRSGRLGANDGGEAGRSLLEHPQAAATPAAHIRRRDNNSWWWGGRGGLGRIGAASNGGCAAKVTRREAAAAADGIRSAGLEAALGLPRGGGGGGGYNYDDDYYGGAEGGGGDDPYYEDGAKGWGDDAWGGDDRGGRGDRYDPYEERRGSSKTGGRGRGKSGAGGFDLTGTITNGNKKYGIYALAGSILLTMMGVSLMFEKNLIRLGNLGFVAGMTLFIGPSNVVRYFTQASKLRGSVIFAVGFFFVFTGHPIIGLAVEVFGFLNLFGNMLPMVWAMASNMPFVKEIMGSGPSKGKKGRSGNSSRQKRSSRAAPSRDDYDYGRQGGGYGYDDDDWDNGGGGGGGGRWGGYDE
ncbi:unnamed protein product [Ectocarpus sp. 4 AP-2014]